MLEIFQYSFMIRALIAGIIIGILAPIIGTFLVLKRYSLLADTLSHVSLVGVAIAIILNINPIIGAIAAASIAAFGMEKLREERKVLGESVLALFLSGSLALAVMILSLSHGLNMNIFTYLFGNIVTVSESDLWVIGSFGLIVLIIVVALFKKFFLVSYDEELSKANGVPSGFLNILLIILAAVTVSLSMRIVGILLTGSLMVIPVLTAAQFSKSFLKTAIYAVIISLISVIAGLFTSFYFNLPSGGTIAIISLIIFGLSLLTKTYK